MFFPIGTPSPHAPFTPAPQYENHFPDMKAPRIPSFNHMEEDNEGLFDESNEHSKHREFYFKI